MGIIFCCKCCPGEDRDELYEWLKLVNEEPYNKEQKICDAHHHLWNPFVQPKGELVIVRKLRWLKKQYLQTGVDHFGKYTPVAEKYMHDDLINDIKSHNVVSSIYVECGWGDKHSKVRKGEIEMAQAVAYETNNRICTGIIGYIDLNLGSEIEKFIVEYKEIKNFRGIRHAITYSEDKTVHFFGSEAYDGMGLNDKFLDGLKILAKYKLTYESWHYHTQLKQFAEMARAVPDLTFICDHVGNPIGIGDYYKNRGEQKVFEEWKDGIYELAKCPNVMIKLSGLTMPLSGLNFDKQERPPTSEELAAKLRPYILHTIRSFGVERCMFASNFPMDKVSCSYTVLFNAFQRIVEDFSVDEQDMLFYANAMRIYKLERD